MLETGLGVLQSSEKNDWVINANCCFSIADKECEPDEKRNEKSENVTNKLPAECIRRTHCLC